jgi:hypothetical protein
MATRLGENTLVIVLPLKGVLLSSGAEASAQIPHATYEPPANRGAHCCALLGIGLTAVRRLAQQENTIDVRNALHLCTLCTPPSCCLHLIMVE